MALAIQFDFFKPVPTEAEMLRMDVAALQEQVSAYAKSSDRVRKGTYANRGKIDKRATDLESRLEILERHICQKTIVCK